MKSKILNKKDLTIKIKEAKENKKIVVLTSGCFDILHAGHVEYLEEAKSRGDLLIVLLNSDTSVRQLKGITRPLISQIDRAIVLAGLASVDYIYILDEKTPCSIIQELQPDIFVKGGDYQGTSIPEMKAVATYGGRVEYVLMLEGRSTTNIIKKIEEYFKETLL